ncbi:MAG: heme exporter protein CcmD [Xanthomonadales bacterium]|nr:heme exporter protein CcmD [Xanthomonadales bacterium]
MPQLPFVIGAYAAFFLVLLLDALQPWLASRRLRRELRARLARAGRREERPR